MVADLAAEAESAGWDGVFVWDHMLYRAPVDRHRRPVDHAGRHRDGHRAGPHRPDGHARSPAAGPRSWPGRPCRSTACRPAGCVLGVGMGGDPGGELTAFGEELDPQPAAAMLDEALEVLVDLWSGESVLHRGERYVAEAARMAPPAVQQPRIPIWVGARHGNRRPLRRAARYEGLFPVQVDEPDQLAEMVAVVQEHRLTSRPLRRDDRPARRRGGRPGGLVRRRRHLVVRRLRPLHRRRRLGPRRHRRRPPPDPFLRRTWSPGRRFLRRRRRWSLGDARTQHGGAWRAAVMRRAAGTAARRALALLRHSRSSSAAHRVGHDARAGLHRRACRRAGTTIVRMAMAVSMLPEKSR